jgi:glycine/serine hydroxymethyltransferase
MRVGSFYLTGMQPVEQLLTAAEQATRTMLGAQLVNLNCLSGIHAMMSVVLAVTQPGDVVMSIGETDGGHFSTQGVVTSAGRGHVFAVYDKAAHDLDYAATAQAFEEAGAKAIYLDISDHLKPVDVGKLRDVLGDEAIIIYDASHTLGLVMGGAYPSPLAEGADVLVANTHKTFAGPQKAVVAFRDAAKFAAANDAINSLYVSSAHTHELMALAVAILEAAAFGHDYAQAVVANASRLGAALAARGYQVAKAGQELTYNHQIHVLMPQLSDPTAAHRRLARTGISVNFKHTMHPVWYMRIGVQGITRLGMNAADMELVADLIDRSLRGDDVRAEVAALMEAHDTVAYSFDHEESYAG